MHALLFFLMYLVFGFTACFVFLMALAGPPESFSKEYFVDAARLATLMVMFITVICASLVVLTTIY